MITVSNNAKGSRKDVKIATQYNTLIPTTVHPRLSEQAELNLKTGHMDMPKVWIIEDDLLRSFPCPQKGSFFDMTEKKTTAEKKITFCV